MTAQYYTAGQALHPPPAAAFRSKPQDIKPHSLNHARASMVAISLHS
jgi:hypothetical protein